MTLYAFETLNRPFFKKILHFYYDILAKIDPRMSYSSGGSYQLLTSNDCGQSDIFITLFSFLSHDVCPIFTGHGAWWVDGCSRGAVSCHLSAISVFPIGLSLTLTFQVGQPAFLPDMASPSWLFLLFYQPFAAATREVADSRQWPTPLEGIGAGSFPTYGSSWRKSLWGMGYIFSVEKLNCFAKEASTVLPLWKPNIADS